MFTSFNICTLKSTVIYFYFVCLKVQLILKGVLSCQIKGSLKCTKCVNFSKLSIFITFH